MLHDVHEINNNVYDLLMFIVILFDYMEERWSVRMDNMVFLVILPNALIHSIHPCTPTFLHVMKWNQCKRAFSRLSVNWRYKRNVVSLKIVPFGGTQPTVENDNKLKRHEINAFSKVIWLRKSMVCCIKSHQLFRSLRTKLSFCSQIHALHHSYFQLVRTY